MCDETCIPQKTQCPDKQNQVSGISLPRWLSSIKAFFFYCHNRKGFKDELLPNGKHRLHSNPLFITLKYCFQSTHILFFLPAYLWARLIDRPWPALPSTDTSIMMWSIHLHLWSKNPCHALQKNIIFTKSSICRKKERTPILFFSNSECYSLKIKNSGLWIRVGPSVSLSLGAAMTTPPLSQLRNGFPLFAFLLMLQIANSFLLLLSLSLRWGDGKKKSSFVQAGPI